MKRFTAERNPGDADQLWMLQHPPVYTLGLAARKAHLPRTDTHIPVIKTDRGGQITYHGPGQIVVYTLVTASRLTAAKRRRACTSAMPRSQHLACAFATAAVIMGCL
jgi:lipoyl(octanoyl) transferase